MTHKYIEIYRSYWDPTKDFHVIEFRHGYRRQQAIGVDEDSALDLAVRISSDPRWAQLRRVS